MSARKQRFFKCQFVPNCDFKWVSWTNAHWPWQNRSKQRFVQRCSLNVEKYVKLDNPLNSPAAGGFSVFPWKITDEIYTEMRRTKVQRWLFICGHARESSICQLDIIFVCSHFSDQQGKCESPILLKFGINVVFEKFFYCKRCARGVRVSAN